MFTFDQNHDDSLWLKDFHMGDRDVLGDCYRQYYMSVENVVGRYVCGADKETLIHEIFFRLISDKKLRLNFVGGSFRAWIMTVARNQTIDFVRRYARECPLDLQDEALNPALLQPKRDDEYTIEKKRLLEEFVRNVLPKKWQPLFQIRFVEQHTQQETAEALKMPRTTLMYQEMRIRKLLKNFWLKGKATCAD